VFPNIDVARILATHRVDGHRNARKIVHVGIEELVMLANAGHLNRSKEGLGHWKLTPRLDLQGCPWGLRMVD